MVKFFLFFVVVLMAHASIHGVMKESEDQEHLSGSSAHGKEYNDDVDLKRIVENLTQSSQSVEELIENVKSYCMQYAQDGMCYQERYIKSSSEIRHSLALKGSNAFHFYTFAVTKEKKKEDLRMRIVPPVVSFLLGCCVMWSIGNVST